MQASEKTSGLASAEQSTLANHGDSAVSSTVTPCAQAEPETRSIIEVIVAGEDGAGVDGVSLTLTRNDESLLRGKTGPTGAFTFKGLETGSYRLCLPELDKGAWVVDSMETLEDTATRSLARPVWQVAQSKAVSAEQIRVIRQGECMSKIAEAYGFFPQTIWDYQANQELKELRHGNMYVLLENDQIVIPVKQTKTETITAGVKVFIQRLGVPERLRVRFVHRDKGPRVGIPYLLSMVTSDETPVADISSHTDDEGYVDQPVPVKSIFANIILNPASDPELYQLDIGYVNPIDEISGWQARLNNLGYECGNEDNVMGPETRAAILAFQYDQNLSPTGERDGPTQEKLIELSEG